MLLPPEFYPLHDQIRKYLPHLLPAQQKGLALWVGATLKASSGCQNAVLGVLLILGYAWHTMRQYLREWLYDGADRAAPCATQLDVTTCFAPLLRWVLDWWEGTELTLAIDPHPEGTRKGEELVALVISVVYRGCAVPVAWRLKPGGQKGAWKPDLCALLDRLGAVVPDHWTVRVLCDRGLPSPDLWQAIRDQGWHPYMRYPHHITFQTPAGPRRPARQFIARPGQYTVTTGRAFREHKRCCTLLVLWGPDQPAPWVVLTDEAPDQVDLGAYGLRVWIEQGFRVLKRMGWQWHRTRRVDPDRVDRHWLVLAVATLWVLAYGTRVEEAALRGLAPGRLRTPPLKPTTAGTRPLSVFQLGLRQVQHLLPRGYAWARVWLQPTPGPDPPPDLQWVEPDAGTSTYGLFLTG